MASYHTVDLRTTHLRGHVPLWHVRFMLLPIGKINYLEELHIDTKGICQGHDLPLPGRHELGPSPQ